jgi:hypothetical protein
MTSRAWWCRFSVRWGPHRIPLARPAPRFRNFWNDLACQVPMSYMCTVCQGRAAAAGIGYALFDTRSATSDARRALPATMRSPVQVAAAPVPVPPPNRDITNLEFQFTIDSIHYVMYGNLLTWQQSKAYCEANQMVRRHGSGSPCLAAARALSLPMCSAALCTPEHILPCAPSSRRAGAGGLHGRVRVLQRGRAAAGVDRHAAAVQRQHHHRVER